MEDFKGLVWDVGHRVHLRKVKLGSTEDKT